MEKYFQEHLTGKKLLTKIKVKIQRKNYKRYFQILSLKKPPKKK